MIVELAGANDRPVTPETELVVAFVILPAASTVITGIAVVLPYELATTPVLVSDVEFIVFAPNDNVAFASETFPLMYTVLPTIDVLTDASFDRFLAFVICFMIQSACFYFITAKVKKILADMCFVFSLK